jgi:hypothetical protein
LGFWTPDLLSTPMAFDIKVRKITEGRSEGSQNMPQTVLSLCLTTLYGQRRLHLSFRNKWFAETANFRNPRSVLCYGRRKMEVQGSLKLVCH